MFVMETACVHCHDGCINWMFMYYLKLLYMLMVQAVSRWPFTAEAQNQSRDSPVKFVMAKVATGDICIWIFQFLLSIIPLMLIINLQLNFMLIKRRGKAWGPWDIFFRISWITGQISTITLLFHIRRRISEFRRFIISSKIMQQAT